MYSLSKFANAKCVIPAECAPPDIVEGPADVPGAAVETVLVASSGEVFPWDEVRLPIFIRPVEYDLELTPNLTTLAVSGIVKMVFKVSVI